MAWLIDTNVLSELRGPKPDRGVLAFFDQHALSTMYLSTVVFAELRFGIEIATLAERRTELQSWLTDRIRPMLDGRVLEITENTMFRWRMMVHAGRKIGRVFSQPDLILAATAEEHGLTLVTRNVKDFTNVSIFVLNPWSDQP